MIARLRSAAAASDGQAMVLVIGLIVIVIIIAAGAVTYGLNASRQTVHDQRDRRAQQAADAGLQAQLYTSGQSAGTGYAFNGGTAGLSQLVDCAGKIVNASAQVTGVVPVEVNSSGVCPVACVTVSSSVCTPSSTSPWTALDNEDFYQSELIPNTVPAGSCPSSGSYCDAVSFPEIVSVGCDTTAADTVLTASDSPSQECSGTGASGYRRQLSRELAVMNPTAPLQAIEATNDVTIDSSESNLASSSGLLSVLNTLGIAVTSVSSTTCGLLGLLSSGETTVCNLLAATNANLTNGNPASLGAIDGNINAGHNINLPETTIDLSSSSSSLRATLASLAGNVLSLQSPLSTTGGLAATFEYGNNACAWNQTQYSSYVQDCTSTPSQTMPVVALGATYVQTKYGNCSLSTPVSQRNQCAIARPTFTINSPLFTGTQCSTTVTTNCVTYSGTSPQTPYSASTGDMTLSAGSVQFAPGSYVLCDLSATGTATVTNTVNGEVQIYVLPPSASPCSGDSGMQGSFVATDGISNVLLGTVNGSANATSLLDPSGFQIYVEGDPKHLLYPVGSSTGTTPVQLSGSGAFDGYYGCTSSYGINTSAATPSSSSPCSDDPDTGVYIGNPPTSSFGSLANPDEAVYVYAPQSEVVLNTSLSFEGSLIGFNVDATALSILQDLSVANDSLSSAAQGLSIAQTLSCTPGSGALTGTVSDTYGCG